MTHPEKNPAVETPVWSARNLPQQKPSRMMHFTAVAVAVGLIAIMLASAVKGPIRTGGTSMEPQRFTTSPQQAKEMIRAAGGAPNIRIASDAP
jgi:hypothetical protein